MLKSEEGTFLGRRMTQTKDAIRLWDFILGQTIFHRIIDLGTGHGNLSLYFHLFCIERGVEFYTFDIRRRWGVTSVLRQKLRFIDCCYPWDIFKHIKEIGEFIKKEGITVVYCDNGDKTREFNTFASYLKVGDIIAVHDWNQEVLPESIQKTREEYNLEEIYSEECDKEGKTRFFQKV